MARRQHRAFVELAPQRGTIYDAKDRVLSIYLATSSVYAVPEEIKDKKSAAKVLADELKMDRMALLSILEKKKHFVWIKRKIDSDTEEKIKKLAIKGVHLTGEGKRFYPTGKLFCHILGVTGIDNRGLAGIEFYYDAELSGEYGWRHSYKDAKRREIVSFQNDALPARDGTGLVLTVDEVVQYIIKKEIDEIVKLYRPKGVSCVAMVPSTGEILAMANYPRFNPNDLSGINNASLRNSAVTQSFEPGSVFKVVTASVALEEDIVDLDTEFFCENGAYKIGKRTLRDYKPFGTLNFREIIEKSSNIGVFKVANKLGKIKLSEYIDRFNFGSSTGVDLPGESSGITRDVSGWSSVDMTTIPMGHGIAVTPLQLASCISTIANNGVMMRPFVVRRFLDGEGFTVKEVEPEVLRRVVSKETADQVKELLEGVVVRGTGKNSRIDNFRVCGKTGTAEKVKPEGGYYKGKFIASFIGFAPYERPQVSLVLCVDEPQGKHLASQVAAPAFGNIMGKILSYLEVEGDKDEIKKTS